MSIPFRAEGVLLLDASGNTVAECPTPGVAQDLALLLNRPLPDPTDMLVPGQFALPL